MKAKDWFGVGVRLFGVWMLLSAAQELVFLVNVHLGYSKSTSEPGAFLVHAGVDFLIGIFLISGAKMLVAFAGEWEPEDRRSDDPASAATDHND